MNKRITYHRSSYIAIIALFLSMASQAQKDNWFKQDGLKQHSAFIENKGQIIDQNNKPNPVVLYLLNTQGMNVQLRRGGFSYDLYASATASASPTTPLPGERGARCESLYMNGMNEKSLRSDTSPLSSRRGAGGEVLSHQETGGEVTYHRIDIDFTGCNSNCNTTTEEPSANYLNYYTTGTPAEGVTHVRSFGKVTFTEIYPGIDVEFLTDSARGFKYNIIVHPGADLATVKMKIRGVEPELTNAGNLVMKTSLGTIEETIPASHFVTENNNEKALVEFVAVGHNLFGLKLLNTMPAGATLVVDPIPGRLWATYYGGYGWDNFEYGSCFVDGQGNVISSGNTTSTSNVATSGACQTTYGGNYDAFLVKFNRNGQPLWATYYGGSEQENGSNCTADPAGNVFLCGGTNSSTNIATPGSHKPVYGGSTDGYLAKFDPNGFRLWGTYFGGIETDYCASCNTDGSGNVYICGTAHSATGISTPGSHQPNIGSASGPNAFLAKFDAQGVQIWGTYYGGTLYEVGYSCKADQNGHVIMCGMSRSPNNVSTPGSHQENPGGVSDGFLVLFNSDGQRQWGSYYGGSANDELRYCCFTNDGYIYTSGQVASTNNISSPGCHQQFLTGNPDAMLVRFNMAGVRQWGTYYGGTGFTISWGCAADDSSNVFICGQTNAHNQIATLGSFQPVYGGDNLDAFLVKFNPGGVRQWGTYYGGAITDCGSACATIADTIYLTGRAGPGLATPGSYQPDWAGISDGILVKFVDCPTPGQPGPITGNTEICAPATGVIYSIAPVALATGYAWTVPTGATITGGQNTTTISVDFGPTAVSGYVTVLASNACGQGEPDSLPVTVISGATLAGNIVVKPGYNYPYYTEPAMTNYQWSATGGAIVWGGGTSSSSAVVQWGVAGTGTVSVTYTTPGGCTTSTTLTILIIPDPTINFTMQDTICTGALATITNHSLNVLTSYWNFCASDPGAIPTGENIGNPGGLLSSPAYITLAKDGNDCFSFVTVKGTGVIRYYHGTSFSHDPVSWTNLGNFGMLDNDVEGIQVKNDNGNWYGFVNDNTTMIRLNFGNSLWNVPTAVNIGPFPQFDMAHGLLIVKEGTAWVAFVTCSTGQKLIKLLFRSSLANSPTLYNYGNMTGNLTNPTGMSLLSEGFTRFIYILAGNNTISKFNSGATLINDGGSMVNFGSPIGFNSPGGLAMLNSCGSTIGYWANQSVGNEVGRLTWNPPWFLGTLLGNIGGLSQPHSFSEPVRQNDTLFTYVTNSGNSTLSRLALPPFTNAAVPSSTLFDPPPFSYSTAGIYMVSLTVNDGTYSMISQCKNIVVMNPPSFSLGNDVSVCPGDPAVLDAGQGYGSYLWSTGATTQAITVLASGTYSVTVTKWSCEVTDAVNVNWLPTPAVILGPDQTICSPQTATFDAGACNGCTYQWGNLTTGQTNVGTGQTYTTGTAGTYMVTVTGQNGCTGKDTIQLFAGTTTNVTSSITTGNTTVCAGTPVTFTASGNPTGTSPSWQWKVNGVNAGIGGQIFTYTPANGDCITCVLTSNADCVTGNPATSNQICMTVNLLNPVNLSISSTATQTCAGTPVTFNAFPTNPGNGPMYQWKINAVNVNNANNAVFTYTPVNGDCVTCELTSDISCPTGNPALSNSICMTVDQPLPVSITVTTPQTTVCAGTMVTFTANPTHGGTLPGYQWKVNASNAINGNNATYTYAPLTGDVVTCELTSSDNCVTGNPATSAPVTMIASPILVVSVAISASSNPFCAGSQVTFTANAINAGGIPAYQWKVNGVNAINANNVSYTYNAVAGDVVTCELTSSENCVTGNPALSNAITMIVNTNLPAGVSISTPSNPFCPGTAVTFTATPVNGGSTPGYQWKVNASNVINAINAVFTYSPLPGDLVSCVMTSNLNCVTGNPVTSAPIAMIERAAPSVSFIACFDTITTVNAQPIKLKGGLPPGGQYSGPGVNTTTGIFKPSEVGTGLKTINYTYTNVYTCSAIKSKTIMVLPTPSFICGNNLTDIRDGKSYPTVLIGPQCWMTSNLDFGFTIDDLVPQTDNCVAEKFTDHSSFVTRHSSFYQWDELMQYQTAEGSQGLCPPGWHVPTDAEWATLINFYQGNGSAGRPLQDTIINGFKALRSGVFYLNSIWSFMDFATIFWTSTSSGPTKAISHGMNLYNFSVSLYPASRGNAFGVRCLKD